MCARFLFISGSTIVSILEFFFCKLYKRYLPWDQRRRKYIWIKQNRKFVVLYACSFLFSERIVNQTKYLNSIILYKRLNILGCVCVCERARDTYEQDFLPTLSPFSPYSPCLSVYLKFLACMIASTSSYTLQICCLLSFFFFLLMRSHGCIRYRFSRTPVVPLHTTPGIYCHVIYLTFTRFPEAIEIEPYCLFVRIHMIKLLFT